MCAKGPLKNILLINLPIILLDDVRINRVETFQDDSAGDLIIFKTGIAKINNICSETKGKPRVHSETTSSANYLLQSLNCLHFFLSKISSQTQCSYKTFQFWQSSISWWKIFWSKTFQQNVLQTRALIIWEHSALSNVSNAKLVLLCA